MRTIIDLPDDVVAQLDRLGAAEKRSRAALVREAVGMLLSQRQLPLPEAAFGMWKDRDIDGVDYQRALRSEWDGR